MYNTYEREPMRIQRPDIILASSSKNRYALFSAFEIPFRAIASGIDEDAIVDPDPVRRAEKVAQGKARAVARKNNGIIIAADTFSVFNGVYFQKPKNLDDSRRVLKTLSGNTMQTITGLCILDTHAKTERLANEVIDIQCKKLTEKEIEEYIQNNPVTEWAAAYNPLIEASKKIFQPVQESIYQSAYNGLPIETISEELMKVGYVIDLSKFLRRKASF